MLGQADGYTRSIWMYSDLCQARTVDPRFVLHWKEEGAWEARASLPITPHVAVGSLVGGYNILHGCGRNSVRRRHTLPVTISV